MKLNELMTKDVRTIAADTSAQKAGELMATLDVGALPVVDSGKPIGIITDRDLAIRVVSRNLNPETTKVGEVMSPEPATLSATHDAGAASKLMKTRQIRRVLVVDDAGDVSGIVSLGDLAIALDDASVPGDVLEKVSEPMQPTRSSS